MIEVTEGTDGWFRIMLPKETPADTLLCGVFFARNEDARIFTLINVYNRLKEKKITYESILRMEKESEDVIQEYKGTPSEAPMREMLKSSLERMYELYGHSSDNDTQEWTETRLMTIKASISRHGLVAVARKDASGNRKWGFMSMTGRMVFHMTPRGELAATSKYDHGTFMGYDETIIDFSH